MTQQPDIATCVQCGDALPARGRKGPVRSYCSSKCRVAAHRQRKAVAEPQDPVPLDLSELVPYVPDDGLALAMEGMPARPLGVVLDGTAMGSTDEQVASAVLVARELAFTFGRLAQEARAPFAYRCAAIGKDLQRSLLRHFGAAL